MKGKAVPVSEEFYKAYWNITEHEKYLQRKDWKHNVISFSALDHDGHFVDSIIDEKIDLEKEFKFSHIIFDHGIGEMADFITIEENGDFIYVEMYHCKAKKGRVYNSSVGDVNEVLFGFPLRQCFLRKLMIGYQEQVVRNLLEENLKP